MAVFAIALACCTGGVATADPLAVADALQPSPYRWMRLSPDGRHLLALASKPGAYLLMLLDTDTMESRVLLGPVTDLTGSSARWIANDLVAADDLFAGLTILALDGSVVRSVPGFYVGRDRTAAAGHETIVVRTIGRLGDFERVDVHTGARKGLDLDLPWLTRGWIVDDRGEPRIAMTRSTELLRDNTTVAYFYREPDSRKWSELAAFPFLSPGWQPVELLHDGRSLMVASRDGRDTRAYFRYDLRDRRLGEMMAGHPREDIAAGEGNANDDFRWVITDGLKPSVHWFDTRGAALQTAVDEALPDRMNFIESEAAGKLVIRSYGDIDPGRWYLLDTATSTMKLVAKVNDRIDPATMAPTAVVRYRSADGLEIPAYLTLPKGGKTDLPAIVLVHGGPVARDRWGFDAEVQMLASRGYAVLQPQFRGSAGFGERFEKAGYGEWGRAMQDDVTAGAEWLVKERVADPRRLCIVGASYGGYAAMWAMAHTPRLFRCGVSLAGVTDLAYMLKDSSDINNRPEGRLFRRANVGDADLHAEQFAAVSPVREAARFEGPVLIAHGDLDKRVPIEHSRRLVDALKRNGRVVEWLELPGSGHDLVLAANQQRFFNALFEFLDRNTKVEATN